jgi:hypothetical protein|tara:strand:- start:369 stop:554 length:186 start_codon:yes stop_codon:yes gene_type:complete
MILRFRVRNLSCACLRQLYAVVVSLQAALPQCGVKTPEFQRFPHGKNESGAPRCVFAKVGK